MAEFVMKDLVAKAELENEFEICSRATGSWEHGNPMHKGAQTILRKHSIPFDKGKTSQMISEYDFEYFDEIIAMDDKNVADLQQLAPSDATKKLRKLLVKNIPDPWYTGDFDETYRLVNTGCQKIIEGSISTIIR